MYNNIHANIQNLLVPETHLNITKVKTEPVLFLWQVQIAIVGVQSIMQNIPICKELPG